MSCSRASASTLGGSSRTWRDRILHDPPPELGEVRGDAPPSLEALMFRMLSKTVDGRTPDTRTLVTDLDTVLRDVEAAEGSVDLARFMQDTFEQIRRDRRMERENAVREVLRDSEAANVDLVLDIDTMPSVSDELPRHGNRWRVLTIVALVVLAGAVMGGVIFLGSGNDEHQPERPATVGGRSSASSSATHEPSAADALGDGPTADESGRAVQSDDEASRGADEEPTDQGAEAASDDTPPPRMTHRGPRSHTHSMREKMAPLGGDWWER